MYPSLKTHTLTHTFSQKTTSHIHILQHSQVSSGHQSGCTPHSKRTHSHTHTHFHRKLPHTFIYSNTHRLAVATSQYVPLSTPLLEMLNWAELHKPPKVGVGVGVSVWVCVRVCVYVCLCA